MKSLLSLVCLLFVELSFFVHCNQWNSISNPYSLFSSQQEGLQQLHSKENSIDPSFYSRQLFVYGKSAQVKLLDSHVVIVGDGPVTNEIVKNLALAGIGHISLISMNSSKLFPNLLGEEATPEEYIKALNQNVKVERIVVQDLNDSSIVTYLRSKKFDTFICSNLNMKRILSLNRITRGLGMKLVAIRVHGNSGFIFNDFLSSFTVKDVDGETYKEIPLLTAISFDTRNSSIATIQCIEEENLNLGIGDIIEIHGNGIFSDPIKAKVIDVTSMKSCQIELMEEGAGNFPLHREYLQEMISTGMAIAKKMKVSQELFHETFDRIFVRPKFNPTNSCLSKKQDRALSLVLLAAMKAADFLELLFPMKKDVDADIEEIKSCSLEDFQELVHQELKVLGVDQPELSLKSGGLVGKQWLDFVIPRFYASRNGICPATVSVLGSVAAQEVIKSITGLYQPISQLMMFESLDSCHVAPLNQTGNEFLCESNQNDLLASVLQTYGPEMVNELRKLRVFVVGAGAIGCELLKNFALLGVGSPSASSLIAPKKRRFSLMRKNSAKTLTEEEKIAEKDLWKKFNLSNGGILLTDMDSIEKSNLNRQLLFRSEHIGYAKSIIAAEQVKKINPSINIHPLIMKVDEESEDFFSEQFWQSADLIITALDNVEARKFIDAQCVKYKCWLIDSGTLGTKANTQVVIPFVTESYSSSSDPPEESIPLCTLKSFPYQPEHCIAWGKNLFQQTFVQTIENLKQLVESIPDQQQQSDGSLEDSLLSSFAEDDRFHLRLAVSFWNPSTPHDEAAARKDLLQQLCFALQLFEKYFVEDIETLLRDHPLDEKDEEGNLFWGGSRRYPKRINFDPVNVRHQQFILWTIRVLENLFWRSSSSSLTSPTSAAAQFLGTAKQRKSFSDEEIVSILRGNYQKLVDLSRKKLRRTWKRPASLEKIKELGNLTILEFDKDDLSAGHVQFVQSASNLRSGIYDLRPVDILETQRIAGNIIPALATTTSFIAGQVTLELLKFVSHKISLQQLFQQQQSAINNSKTKKKRKNEKKLTPTPSEEPVDRETFRRFSHSFNEIHRETHLLKRFRNSFVNLANNLISFVRPQEREIIKINDCLSHHLWEELIFQENDIPVDTMSFEGFLDYFRKMFDLEITSIEYEGISLYDQILAGLSSELSEQLADKEEQKKSIREFFNGRMALVQGVEGGAEKEEEEEEEIDYFEGKEKIRLELTAIPVRKDVSTEQMTAAMEGEEDRQLPPVILQVPKKQRHGGKAFSRLLFSRRWRK